MSGADYPGEGFDWTAAEDALGQWVAAVLTPAPPVFWGRTARQRVEIFPAICFEWEGNDPSGLESDTTSNTTELPLPDGEEVTTTTRQMWDARLKVFALCDAEHARGYYSPIALLTRLLTTLEQQPIVDLLQTAGIAARKLGPIGPTADEVQSPDYLPAMMAELGINFTEQATSRLGYLTGVALTGTVNGHSFPISAP
jgi:hypothetical protein